MSVVEGLVEGTARRKQRRHGGELGWSEKSKMHRPSALYLEQVLNDTVVEILTA